MNNQPEEKEKKRYICQKCGRKTAVKHGNNRYRCLKCRSVFGPKSRKMCYNKDETLVLKALMKLFDFYGDDCPRNKKIPLEDFTKMAKEDIDDNSILRVAEVNVIRTMREAERAYFKCFNSEDLLIITKDRYNRFRVYPRLFKIYTHYDCKNAIIHLRNTDKYGNYY